MGDFIDDTYDYDIELIIEDQAQQAGQYLVSPSAISVSEYFDESINVEWEMTKGSTLGWSERLYTAAGTQGLGIDRGVLNDIVANPDDYQNTFLFSDYGHQYGNRAYQERPIFSTKSTPDFVSLKKYYTFQLMNLPVYTRMANCTFDDLQMYNLII